MSVAELGPAVGRAHGASSVPTTAYILRASAIATRSKILEFVFGQQTRGVAHSRPVSL